MQSIASLTHLISIIFEALNFKRKKSQDLKMNIQDILEAEVKNAVDSIYGIQPQKLEFQPTRKDFEGDITLVTFPLLRQIKTNPAQLGQSIGEYLVKNVQEVDSFNVVQGFLNIVLSDNFYLKTFIDISSSKDYGRVPPAEDAKAIM